jgi:hypothetical protein
MEQLIIGLMIGGGFGFFQYLKLENQKRENQTLEKEKRKILRKQKKLLTEIPIVEVTYVKLTKDVDGRIIREEFITPSDSNTTEVSEYSYSSNGIRVTNNWRRWWDDIPYDDDDSWDNDQNAKAIDGQRAESHYDEEMKVETEIEYEGLDGDDVQFKTITYYNDNGKEKKADIYNSQKIRHTNTFKYDQLDRLTMMEMELYYTTDEVTGEDIHKLEATPEQKPKPRIETRRYEYKGESKLPSQETIMSEYGWHYKTTNYEYDSLGRKVSELEFDEAYKANNLGRDSSLPSKSTFFLYENKDEYPRTEISIENSNQGKLISRDSIRINSYRIQLQKSKSG